MLRITRLAIFLVLAALPFIACDEDTTTPPIDEPFVPLLDGEWTLRVSPDSYVDEFLLPVTFAATKDSVFLSTTVGEYAGEISGRQIPLNLQALADDNQIFFFADMIVDVDGTSLTGTIEGMIKSAGDTFKGTLFGVPGDTVPEISVSVVPASLTIPRQASLQLHADITGWSGNAVTWSLDPDDAGTMSSSGRYTAPWSLPDPPQVTIRATSSIDIGAFDTAVIDIEVPPETCEDVYGWWEVWILCEWVLGDGENEWMQLDWQMNQDGCSLLLSDRGRDVELEMSGSYAHGEYIHDDVHYTYNLYLRGGTTILEGSGIVEQNLLLPTEPINRPVRGTRYGVY